jgi:hypothetical protein
MEKIKKDFNHRVERGLGEQTARPITHVFTCYLQLVFYISYVSIAVQD